MKIVAVVLAAGSSSRLGEPKQMVRYRGELLLHRAIRTAAEAGVDAVFTVLGAGADKGLPVLVPAALQSVHPDIPIEMLTNEQWRSGMASSVALGVAAAERAGADAVLLMTCDQPLVTVPHLRELIEMSGSQETVASTYAGRRGVPAVFPRGSFAALKALLGDEGARTLLRGLEVRTLVLPGGEMDVDTPADLQQLRELEAGE